MTTTVPLDTDDQRLSAATVAARTPTDRNRAVDFYRAAAMAVVAAGHWLGMVAVVDHGELTGGNLLDFSPEYAWFTWIGQVMPLFFFVGGFASATSLRSAERKGVRPADWIATRLHRMVTPAAALAGFWAIALVLGAVLGGFGVVALGAAAAAIPLWFLANYTIDTALAPFTYRWFRSRPWRLVGSLVVLFVLAEAARFAGIPVIPQANWVIGWLGFQVAGFAWHDRRLPTGRALAALAAACWVLVIAAVGLGPWPATMLHHGGLEHSPTHPPSFALIVFGLAYSFTAATFAPAVTRWLERSSRAWQVTIAANVVSMSVYLWHMTAAVAVAAVAYATGLLPGVEPGTTAWWWTKIPFLAANLAVLVPIVRRVAPVEQRALVDGATQWRSGIGSMLVVAAVLSVSVKAWSSPQAGVLTGGLTGTLCVWRLALTGSRARRTARLTGEIADEGTRRPRGDASATPPMPEEPGHQSDSSEDKSKRPEFEQGLQRPTGHLETSESGGAATVLWPLTDRCGRERTKERARARRHPARRAPEGSSLVLGQHTPTVGRAPRAREHEGAEPGFWGLSGGQRPLSGGAAGGGAGNRTRVEGFAGPCLNHSATPPARSR